ncbi:hypothetical protein PC116_g11241 [Phytophthora cactorum]|nr:hypothetical protein PC116_g11241 [Phytophthora cactorum]
MWGWSGATDFRERDRLAGGFQRRRQSLLLGREGTATGESRSTSPRARGRSLAEHHGLEAERQELCGEDVDEFANERSDGVAGCFECWQRLSSIARFMGGFRFSSLRARPRIERWVFSVGMDDHDGRGVVSNEHAHPLDLPALQVADVMLPGEAGQLGDNCCVARPRATSTSHDRNGISVLFPTKTEIVSDSVST